MRWLAAGLVAYCVAASAWAYVVSVKLDHVRAELAASKKQIETYKRLQNADISRGDSDADLEWLCKRSRKGCP